MTGPVPGDWAARVHQRLMGGPWGELEVEAAAPPWPCEAYGGVGLEVGAVCFIGDLGRRVCASAATCAEVMTDCRENLYGRLQELAAAGDPFYVELAAGFSSAADLLGGAAEACSSIEAEPAEIPDVPPYYTTDAHGARVEYSSPLVDCGCPEVYGMIRHDRATCTDPVVVRLDWFPD